MDGRFHFLEDRLRVRSWRGFGLMELQCNRSDNTQGVRCDFSVSWAAFAHGTHVGRVQRFIFPPSCERLRCRDAVAKITTDSWRASALRRFASLRLGDAVVRVVPGLGGRGAGANGSRQH